ncbi:MAG: M48 family metallopeptidase [Deltaproteobacteria bacterium]|nr:M48 family metallopeptidase [Deltaproteobacteria bacterium]
MKKILLILFVACSVSCGKDYVTGKSSYNLFSLNTDVQLGAQVISEQSNAFRQKNIAIDSDRNREMLKRVQNIVNRITRVSHIPDLPYEVHVADAPIVNAWAAPGGKIMVYEGLWDSEKGLVKKSSDDELAAVLSHEIAHCTARHVTKSLSKVMTLSMIGSVAATAISGAGSAQGGDLFSAVFSQGMNVYVPAYSRKNESEADRLGLFYMAKAGYNPQAAIEVWKRASQKRGDKTSIYASHPPSGERAVALEKLLPEAMLLYKETKTTQ